MRAALLTLCLLLSIDALAFVSRWRSNLDRLSAILTEAAPDDTNTDTDTAVAIRRVAFERTPHHAKLTVARTLVYQVLAAGQAAVGSPETSERLAVARELALEVRDQQPNNWQAPMFIGAATYLEWSSRSDRRLYTAAGEWERPLLEAMARARGQHEPRRFLAAAYLETWTALSEAKKASTLDLVKTMFRQDPDSFERLGPVWLEVAGTREEALAVVPDRTRPWLALRRSFAEKRDWSSFCLAHGRYLEALRRELMSELEEAAERLRLGDLAGSRQICLTVAVSSPRDGRFADLLSRALELYPPGIHGLRAKDALHAWLRWALELNAIGIDPLSPKVIGRLTDAIGELEPSTGAHAALVAGDTYGIHRYEKLEESARRREWVPYLIAKTKWLVERGELDAAERALREVHRSARSSASYWHARHRLATADDDLSTLATAEERLAGFRSREWRASDWRWRAGRMVLEFYPQGAASGLSVTINKTPAQGAVVEIMLDGSSVAARPASTRQTIELAVEIEPGPHLLELKSLAGGEIVPGAVSLWDP